MGLLFLFPPETAFDITCKFSQMETICLKSQILFSGKNKKNVTKLSSAEYFWLIVLGFKHTSTFVGHFVLSPREREKEIKR